MSARLDIVRQRRARLFDDIVEQGFICSEFARYLIEELRWECEGDQEALRRFDFAADVFIDVWQAAREPDEAKIGRTTVIIQQDGVDAYALSIKNGEQGHDLADEVRSICARHFDLTW